MLTVKLTITEQEGVLIRQLIDMGLKQGGLPAARQLLALDDKVVAAGNVLEQMKNTTQRVADSFPLPADDKLAPVLPQIKGKKNKADDGRSAQ